MLKKFIPPIVVPYLTGFFYGWKGNYKSWSEAQKQCSGYDSEIIFNKVKNALLKVKNGEVVFERDSVLFDKEHYSFPLISALSLVALESNLQLNILDFGGSLGSTYFQNRKLFENLKSLQWNIIEQKHFVDEGKKTFASKQLHFYYTIDECLQHNKINVLLLGSVLQYIEKPFELLDFLISKKIDYIIVDRTPVFLTKESRITIQKVPKKIYEAQYPSWIFNEKNLFDKFTTNYKLVFENTSDDNINIPDACFKTYFFKIK